VPRDATRRILAISLTSPHRERYSDFPDFLGGAWHRQTPDSCPPRS
jgi:hypothetical protein